MSLPVNTFVVFGPEREPEVHLLDERQVQLFRDRENVASREKALVATFGTGVAAAIPAWSQECMELFAFKYEGVHQREVRGVCAAIALGKPFGKHAFGNDDLPGGGERVPLTPSPTSRPPRGDALAAPKAIRRGKGKALRLDFGRVPA